MTDIALQVTGMSCDGCVKAVERIIKKQDPAGTVRIDLSSGRVDVQSDLDAAQIAAALTAAGYPAALA